jgi:hypothetical protein
MREERVCRRYGTPHRDNRQDTECRSNLLFLTPSQARPATASSPSGSPATRATPTTIVYTHVSDEELSMRVRELAC